MPTSIHTDTGRPQDGEEEEQQLGARARLTRALGQGARGVRQWAGQCAASCQARIQRVVNGVKGLGTWGRKTTKWGALGWTAAAMMVAVVCLHAAAPGLAQAMALPAPSGDGACVLLCMYVYVMTFLLTRTLRGVVMRRLTLATPHHTAPHHAYK